MEGSTILSETQVLKFSTHSQLSTIEVIPSLGGAINRLVISHSVGESLERREVIAPLTAEDFDTGNPYYKGVLLFPFVNRLDGGQYSFDGVKYSFDINEKARANSLHGFLFETPVDVSVNYLSNCELVVKIDFAYKGNIVGYPFPADVQIEYRLHDIQGLTVNFKVTNLHGCAIPLAVGWHPYFKLAGPLSRWDMQLPAAQCVEVDERLLPTGNKTKNLMFNDFAELAGVELDHCFELANAAQVGVVSTLVWSEDNKYGIDIWQQTGLNKYNYLQICIPPQRNCVAIEPVSANINAFNTGDGLIRLETGDVFEAQCGVRLLDDMP